MGARITASRTHLPMAGVRHCGGDRLADPAVAITRILAGEALPDTRFDITTTLCKIRDLFSRY